MMQTDKLGSRFDRVVGHMAWLVLWTIVGGLGAILKMHYRYFHKAPDSEADEGTNPVRIGFCENGAGYGGAIISLAAFLEKLPKQYEAVIYTSIGTEQYSHLGKLGRWRHLPPVRLLDCARLGIGRIPLASMLDNLLNLLPYAARYYLAFKRDKIQCVYLNNDASCNFAPAIAARFAGIPMVLHARGFNSDTKGNRWVLSKVDHCLAVSSAIQDDLSRLGVPPGKCTIVPEGLDLAKFYPRQSAPDVRNKLNIKEGQPVITLVGGLVDWKGQDILLDAAPQIFKSCPTAAILIVGGAYGKDDEFANMIAKRAAAADMESRVHLLGMRADVADIMACSDVIIHASTKPEPFGRTFLEGMALGKAVIASNEGGPVDVISHGVDGLLIEPRDPRKLAGAIDQLLNNPILSSELGKKAALKATAYSIENHTVAVSAVLQSVLTSDIRGQMVLAEALAS